MTDLSSARARFATASLPYPPVPADLESAIVEFDDFLFGTRDDGPRPYDIDWYVEELMVLGPSVEPYVLTGHDGRGMNSWAIHFLMVHGHVAVFDQIAWGGAYTDDELAVQLMAAHWTQIADLVDATDAAAARGLLARDERYVVVASDFYGSRWWRGILGTEPDWRAGGSLEVVLDAAIDAQLLVE